MSISENAFTIKTPHKHYPSAGTPLVSGSCQYCSHKLEPRIEQMTLHTVLIMGECVNPDCPAEGSTVTIGERPQTPAEREYIALNWPKPGNA